MPLLKLEGICKQKIIESVPYNEIKKLPKFLQNKVLTINKIFSFDDSLYTSEYKQSPHVYDNYFEEGTEEHYTGCGKIFWYICFAFLIPFRSIIFDVQ
jgi:hypothetical protein